ncbi:MAG: methionyl-tRNA formyltransferase [Elusimicrobia bacterium]|nr:methionyl-tRNA formyltransferase [Elusimicrobiota bacterium]
MKTIFLGTPVQAVPFLKTLCEVFPPALVITRPDAKSGRGQQLLPSPVKAAALAAGIPCAEPRNDEEFHQAVLGSGAEAAFVVAYGRIMKERTLALLPKGFVNIHFSILPAYRGAAPAQWALINGETRTGVSAFRIDGGLDTGPMLGSRELEVSISDDAASLMDRLVPLGAELMRETALGLADGTAQAGPQSGQPSYAPKIGKELARLDFSKTALEVHNLARGLQLGPLPYVMCPVNGRLLRLQVLKTAVAAQRPGLDIPVPNPGRIASIERPGGIVVECKHSLLLVETVRPEGKRPMPALDFANGLKLKPGGVFAQP